MMNNIHAQKWNLFLNPFFLVMLCGCSALPSLTLSQTATTTLTSSATVTNTYTPTPSSTNTATPSPTATASATMTPSPTPTAMGGSGMVVFESYDTRDGKTDLLGIQLINLANQQTVPIPDKNFRLLDGSPDGKQMLVSKDASIYVLNLDGSDALELAANVFDTFKRAIWYATGKIVFLGWEDNSRFLYEINPDGSGLVRLTQKGMRPVSLFPSSGRDCYYWASGSINGFSTNIQTYWCQPTDGSPALEMKIEYPSISPADNLTAYFFYDERMTKIESIIIQDLASGQTTQITEKLADQNYLGGPDGIFWSPDGGQILTQISYCSSGGTDRRTCVISSDHVIYKKTGEFVKKLILPVESGWINHFEWSPDGKMLLFENIVAPGSVHYKYLYDITNDELINISEYFTAGLIFGRYFWVSQNP